MLADGFIFVFMYRHSVYFVSLALTIFQPPAGTAPGLKAHIFWRAAKHQSTKHLDVHCKRSLSSVTNNMKGMIGALWYARMLSI